MSGFTIYFPTADEAWKSTSSSTQPHVPVPIDCANVPLWVAAVEEPVLDGISYSLSVLSLAGVLSPFSQCISVVDDVSCALIDVKPLVYVGILVSSTQGFTSVKQ